MPSVADADALTLTVGEFTRRGVLWAHGTGMFLTSLLFMFDATRGAFLLVPAFAPIQTDFPGGAVTWTTIPLCASLALIGGLGLSRWRWAVSGLLGLSLWYGAMTFVVLYWWIDTGMHAVIGPVGVYGLVLFPKAVMHAISVGSNGRRLDREQR